MNSSFPGLPFPQYLIYIIMVWSIAWKGLALWHSARNNQKNWFLVMLVINTIGIMEIVYLFGFSKKKLALKDLAFWKTKEK